MARKTFCNNFSVTDNEIRYRRRFTVLLVISVSILVLQIGFLLFSHLLKDISVNKDLIGMVIEISSQQRDLHNPTQECNWCNISAELQVAESHNVPSVSTGIEHIWLHQSDSSKVQL